MSPFTLSRIVFYLLCASATPYHQLIFLVIFFFPITCQLVFLTRFYPEQVISSLRVVIVSYIFMTLESVCCSVMSNSFVTPWTIAHQAPLSMEFSRQEY